MVSFDEWLVIMICTAIVGEEGPRMKLTAWKTIPFVEDECVTGTDAIATLSCLSWWHSDDFFTYVVQLTIFKHPKGRVL